MSLPDVAVLISSYQRPRHLERVLASLAVQVGVESRFEVVVTDDGSTDRTFQVVERFAADVDFPVSLTSHPHDGYQLARCRNEGVAVSQAAYLLFLDGDCLVPPDHLQQHLFCRRPGRAMAGYCCLLGQEETEALSTADVRSGSFTQLASRHERRKLRRLHRRSLIYSLFRHPTKPRLFGGNVGIHRVDYERVNGYDENFVGWGCEDDDLRLRLRLAGIRVHSILRQTCTYHLWHPKGETTPDAWRRGANVAYLQRTDRTAACDNGLAKHLESPQSIQCWRWNQPSVSSTSAA